MANGNIDAWAGTTVAAKTVWIFKGKVSFKNCRFKDIATDGLKRLFDASTSSELYLEVI